MITFAARRHVNIVVTALLAVVVVTSFAIYDASLHQGSFFTGWTLLAVMLFLALYNVRKKITVLPLGSASTWMQCHIYAGWLVLLLFAEHINWRIPDGGLEITMSILFVLVAGSGVVGLLFSRSLPARLTRRGEEVIFERIPAFIARLREEAEQVVLQSTQETQSSTIGEFYLEHLSSFFSGPRNALRQLIGSRRVQFGLLNEITNLERYLNPQERKYAERLRELTIKKDDLDYHYALNLALKGWLLVHVPLTYSLLLLAALHVVVVYAFSGGIG